MALSPRNPTNFPSISGYAIIEQLYTSSRTAVYRAVQLARQQSAIVKVLQQSNPSFNELLQFRNQYAIAKDLDIPGIVRPLSLEPWQNGYALVMEDCGSISLAQYVQQHPLDGLGVLKVALQLAQTLHHLHNCRVIHKDIKPANILIHPQTHQVKLIDFSIASLLPKESPEVQNLTSLEGTLSYIAPEQTGRMNRGLDYRADFYSFGITLYELFTGQLPFQFDDPVELVHAHIARDPVPPHCANPTLPVMLSRVVLKLMAKNAEDRYQSALGLKFDLERCWQQWQETGEIAEFELGRRDVCDRFIIPEKLYGREGEVARLLDAFERVSGRGGEAELVLVAGASGIGKTAIVEEVRKPILRQRGYFIKGKFDQFNRNIPFSAFVQAFRNLIEQLLSESETQLQQWRTQILEAIGGNGQAIIEVIPELELLIGKQPPVTELSGHAAQNRFNLVFPQFVRVFARRERPLVIFLDDWQWADFASLKLLQLLLENSQHLLILGAYRDNEVSPVHPFAVTVEALDKAGAIGDTIVLQPLSPGQIDRLVADTLNCSEEAAKPLSEIIYQRAQGNPFYTTQFLRALYRDELLKFEREVGSWHCDLSLIKRRSTSEDALEFMTAELQKMPVATREILTKAACIGAQFDLNAIAIISEQSEAKAAANLWPALQAGLLIPQNQSYKFFQVESVSVETDAPIKATYQFLHDRVQQAAYSLIPDDQKEATHYQIGRLLLERIPVEKREEGIFELANQLNRGIALIVEVGEREELARLNLLASRKARATIAYQAGRNYVETGLSLLGESAWQRQYEMTLEFYELAAELAFLGGDLEAMERFMQIVIQQSRSTLDLVKVYRLKIQATVARNQLTEALELGQTFLAQLGVELPETLDFGAIMQDLGTLQQQIGAREVEALVDLPLMTDKTSLAIVQICSSLFGAAYLSASPLFFVIIGLCIRLSIQYGNTQFSGLTYVSYSFILTNFLRQVERGFQFGKLGLAVIDKLNDKVSEPEALFLFSFLLSHRKFHLKDSIPGLKESYSLALAIGEFNVTDYAARGLCTYLFWSGAPLTEVLEEVKKYYPQGVKNEQYAVFVGTRLFWESTIAMLCQTEPPTVGSGETFEEDESLQPLLVSQNANGLFEFYSSKLFLSYLFGQFALAKKAACEVKKYLISGQGYIGQIIFHFYNALMILAELDSTAPEFTEDMEAVEKDLQELRFWAQFAPMNYQHKVDLVEAEKYRVLGQKYEAADYYDRAIAGAKANEYIQEEALSNELAAKFYWEWNKPKFAAHYLQEAYYHYTAWGAKAKVADLESNYPHLLAPLRPFERSSTSPSQTRSSSLGSSHSAVSNSSSQNLLFDFPAAMKAAQAISEEIALDKLLERLQQIAIANAGAQTSYLILHQNSRWVLVASSEEGELASHDLSSEQELALPKSLIQAVVRSKEIAVFDNLSADVQFAGDPDVIARQPKSVLCVPLNRQGQIIGILYLENNLTEGAFTRDRIEILQLLAGQAAVSIENARLYQEIQNYSQTLEVEVERKTQDLNRKACDLESALTQLQRTQAQLIQTEKMSSLGQLVAGVAHEINNPVSFIKGNLGHTQNYVESLIELLNLYRSEYPQPSEAIQAQSEEIDLDFLLRDVTKILNSMKVGSDRISQIVLSLRNFSRLDEAEFKQVDIHSGLESTLLILHNRLQATTDQPEIRVVKSYGNLPLVTCYASQLNQVFLNIINNAIDAIRENSESSDCPEIKIATSLLDPEKVRIAIANTDSTIPLAIQKHIFEPFFTTKKIGRGTGLGLFISYSTIQKHQGTLAVRSQPGEDTEFEIILPRQQVKASQFAAQS